MRMVVTGAAGKIGRAVVRELLAHGHEVVPVDRHASDDAPSPPMPPMRLLDLRDAAAIGDLFAGAAAVCHLGSMPWIPHARPAEGFANNVDGTFNVFHHAAEAGVRRFVYASSIQAYGVAGEPGLVSPPLYVPIDEEHPMRPRSAYALSKWLGEEIGAAFARRSPEFQVFSFRFTAVKPAPALPPALPPPGAPADAKPQRLEPLHHSLRTHVPAADAARAVRLAFEVDRPGHTPLNIVAARSAFPWTPDQITAAFGPAVEIRRPPDPTLPLIDPARAKAVLGFEA